MRLLVLLFIPLYLWASPQEVIFDQSNEQIYSPFDTGFAGLSKFSILIKKMGLSISINSRPLHQFLPHLGSKGKILVLGVAINKKYSSKDLDAIKTFIANGGGVLVNVEHDNLFKNGSFQNELTSPFGIEALATNALGKGNWKGSIWPRCVSDYLDLDNIYLYLPAPLKISGHAKSLLQIKDPMDKNKKILTAWSKYKKGNLIVIGDQEILWNMTSASGIRKGNNSLFMTKILNILLNEKVKNNKKSKFGIKKDKKALFYTASFALGPDSSTSGLNALAQELNNIGYQINVKNEIPNFNEFDLVIVATPLTQLKNPSKLKKAKKLLLISDGQTDVLKNNPDFVKVLTADLGLAINNTEYKNPLNILLKEYGIEFFSGTLTKKGENHFFINSIFRGTFINKLQNSNLLAKVLTSGKKDILPLYNIVPRSEDPSTGIPFGPFDGTIDLNSYPIVVTSKKLMLISDLELVSNQYFSKKSFEQIKNWLDNL